MQILKENEIKTYCFISPVIPEVTDVEWIIQETKDFADFYLIKILNLKGAGKEFISWLKDNFPKSYGILTNKNLLLGFTNNIKNLCKDVALKEIILHVKINNNKTYFLKFLRSKTLRDFVES